jgi:hypothetical protein
MTASRRWRRLKLISTRTKSRRLREKAGTVEAHGAADVDEYYGLDY